MANDYEELAERLFKALSQYVDIYRNGEVHAFSCQRHRHSEQDHEKPYPTKRCEMVVPVFREALVLFDPDNPLLLKQKLERLEKQNRELREQLKGRQANGVDRDGSKQSTQD